MFQKEKDVLRYIRRLRYRVRLNKKTFKLLMVLRTLVILTLVLNVLQRNYEAAALCILSLILFLMPSFFEKQLKIEIPPLFEGIIYCFIFAAEILGEVNHSYVLIPGWDTMLHTLNGFLCAAVGFSLVDLFNRHSERIALSPIYLTIVAFCFSMTVGVIWEFFEYTMDQLFYLDMQKDFIVKNIGSVTLDPTGMGTPIKVSNITRTIIETASGKEYVIEGGYLDIGINDTMKDLIVNFIGDLAFSVLGYLYVADREKKTKNAGVELAKDLLIYRTDEDRPLPDKGKPATEGVWKEIRKAVSERREKDRAKHLQTLKDETHAYIYDEEGNIVAEKNLPNESGEAKPAAKVRRR